MKPALSNVGPQIWPTGCGLVPFTVTSVFGYEIKKLAPLREVARKDGNRQDLVGKSVPEATNSTWGHDAVKF
ncbi:unnamed protein product [Clonostachys chloroleuca]|uniref:Uncharacterized protein n=1 Tax=Clonostachys chloroleuca TaxID=1926264 RepID=A0AA35MID5_9HYPO|nr:unnamed protein product [Clonostachys chloroleuca]